MNFIKQPITLVALLATLITIGVEIARVRSGITTIDAATESGLVLFGVIYAALIVAFGVKQGAETHAQTLAATLVAKATTFQLPKPDSAPPAASDSSGGA
jgi:hypothetical protein